MMSPPNVEPADTELLARAIQGDAGAFGVLYERYLDEIQRYIFFRVADRFEAEDLTETVFLRAWEGLPRLGSSGGNFRAWLYRVAHNITIDFYRSRKAVAEPPAADMRDSQPLPEHQIQTRDAHRHLAEALQSLEVRLQQVIICRFVNGLSHGETAEIMGLQEGHVRVLQLRALQKLRLILDRKR